MQSAHVAALGHRLTGTDASDAASTEIAIRAGDGAQARASEPARAHDSGTRRVRTFHCPGKQEDSQGGQGVCGEAATCAEAAHCQHKWERSGDSLGDELAERESESRTAWKYGKCLQMRMLCASALGQGRKDRGDRIQRAAAMGIRNSGAARGTVAPRGRRQQAHT